jgi:hypothetical protein
MQQCLDATVGVLERAVHLTPPFSTDYARHQLALGAGYLLRAELRDSDPGDIERAATCFRVAIDVTPQDSPDLPRRLSNLSRGLRAAADPHLDDPAQTAIYRRTCELGLDADVHTTMITVHHWGRWAARRQAWRKQRRPTESG